MIRFLRNSWWVQVTYIAGGIWPLNWRGFLAYLFYSSCTYVALKNLEIDYFIFDMQTSIKFLFGFVSFLMIFRLNHCHSRYEAGKAAAISFFNALHQINSIACGYLLSVGKEQPELTQDTVQAAIAFRVHVIRLTLATSAALKLHCRIAETVLTHGVVVGQKDLLMFDYIRLRGLLYEQEYQMIDEVTGLFVDKDTQSSCGCGELPPDLRVQLRYKEGDHPFAASLFSSGQDSTSGIALPVITLQMLRQHLMRGATKAWGFPERMINLLEPWLAKASLDADKMDALITMPLPLAYLQHCKTLFMLFFAIYPLAMKTSDGWWENVVSPCLLFAALYGFEALSDMMENPLGDDVIDLNVFEMMHDFEIRSAAIFKMTTDRWWVTQSVVRLPMECMPLEGSDPLPPTDMSADIKKLCKTWGFDAHFTWCPLPPHVICHVAYKMTGYHGCAEDLVRGVDTSDDSNSRYMSVSTNTQPLVQLGVENIDFTTSFLCLRSRKERVEEILAEHLSDIRMAKGSIARVLHAMNINVDPDETTLDGAVICA